MFGGDGNDRLYTGTGGGFADGGNGNDWVSGDSVLPSEKTTLEGSSGNDRLVSTGPGSFTVNGDSGNDRIVTSRGADDVFGGSGRDRIAAGAGNDHVHTADGQRDVVTCGRGNDTVEADKLDKLSGCEHVTRVNIQLGG
jgi:Ca2+-binding RTX toxin-like protein